MSAMPGAASVVHRQRVLRALGVVPYRLRRGSSFPAGVAAMPATKADAPAHPADTTTCVWVLPADRDARQNALLERIQSALGSAFAQASQVDVVAGELAGPVPAAQAYLALGEAQARALGRALSVDVMARAEVLLLDTPQALLQTAGKRRLWQAVAGLRRRWRDRDALER